MHFYSIHVIAEFNLSGSEIICRQIYMNGRATPRVVFKAHAFFCYINFPKPKMYVTRLSMYGATTSDSVQLRWSQRVIPGVQISMI